MVTRGLHWLERRTQRAADATLCVNEYLEERLVAAGARPERVTIVRNGPVLARVLGAERDESLLDGHAYLCCWVGKMGRQQFQRHVSLQPDVARAKHDAHSAFAERRRHFVRAND